MLSTRVIFLISIISSCSLMISCDYPEFNFSSLGENDKNSTMTGTNTEMETGNADPKNTFAIINGVPVPRTLYSLYAVQRKNERPISNKNDAQNELENEFINMELLAQDAIKRGLDKNDGISSHIQLQKKSILVNAVIKELQRENPIIEEQLNDEYQSKYLQTTPMEYSTRHILVKEESTANEIIKNLTNGDDFSTLAINHSVGPAAKEGGALEWFKPEDVIPEFYSAVSKLEKGQYTKTPANSKYGWHIILLEDTRQGKAPDFELVKNKIRMELQSKNLEQYIQSLRDQSNIQVLPESTAQ